MEGAVLGLQVEQEGREVKVRQEVEGDQREYRTQSEEEEEVRRVLRSSEYQPRDPEARVSEVSRSLPLTRTEPLLPL